jgi:hypothetical protein
MSETKQEVAPALRANCGRCGLNATTELIDAGTRRCLNQKMCAWRAKKAEQFAAKVVKNK